MSEEPPVRVCFLGSGELAIPVCRALCADARIQVADVGTQPDRPAGRRRRLTPTPFAAWADAHGLSCRRIESVNTSAFLESLRDTSTELLIVASFGQLLKPAVLDCPLYGCLNVHASLLPRHRGASPVNAAILAGDETTGISFMKMDAGLDTGPVYARHEIAIRDDDTAVDLEARLGDVAAAHICDCVWAVAREGLVAKPQDQAAATHAPKLRTSQGAIDWRADAARIQRQVRALQPWPKAYTHLNWGKGSRRLQITAAAVNCNGQETGQAPGTVVQADDGVLLVACGNGCLEVRRVIPEGRSEMSAEEFLRGRPIAVGTLCEQPGGAAREGP